MLKLKELGVTHLLIMIADSEFVEIGVNKLRFQEIASLLGIKHISVHVTPGLLRVSFAGSSSSSLLQ